MTSTEDKIELIKGCNINFEKRISFLAKVVTLISRENSCETFMEDPVVPGFAINIMIWDVFSVLSNPEAAKALNDLLIAHCTQHIHKIQAICALESRGFLFGSQLAFYFNLPFVPIRKKGKLPGSVKCISYNLEYGSETFEIQTDALKSSSNVLLVDDLMATGGSLAAGCKLIGSVGCNVDHCLVVMELEELNGRNQIPCLVHSLIKL